MWNVTLALPECKSCGRLLAFCKATETKGVAAAHASVLFYRCEVLQSGNICAMDTRSVTQDQSYPLSCMYVFCELEINK